MSTASGGFQPQAPLVDSGKLGGGMKNPSLGPRVAKAPGEPCTVLVRWVFFFPGPRSLEGKMQEGRNCQQGGVTQRGQLESRTQH